MFRVEGETTGYDIGGGLRRTAGGVEGLQGMVGDSR